MRGGFYFDGTEKIKTGIYKRKMNTVFLPPGFLFILLMEIFYVH